MAAIQKAYVLSPGSSGEHNHYSRYCEERGGETQKGSGRTAAVEGGERTICSRKKRGGCRMWGARFEKGAPG